MMNSLSSTGGTQIKFAPTTGTDSMVRNGLTKDIPTKLMCITAMQQYQSKSLEELRVEDYQANRKFPTAGSTTSVFGSGGTTSSIFGNASATGQTSAFGATSTTTGFGTTNSLFGNTQTQQQPVQGSIFGGASQKPLFGGSTQPASTSFFGNTSTTPTQQGTSLFGNQAKPGGMFGGTTQQTSTGFGTNTSLFGSTPKPFGTAGTTTAFGSPATAPVFGNTTNAAGFGTGTSMFNNQQPAQTGSIFGNTAQKPSIFGNAASTGQTPAFGAASTTTGFGNTGSMFGNNQTQQQPVQGSIFGNQAKPGGMFGGATTQPASSGFLSNNSTTQNQPGTGLFGNQAKPGSVFGGATQQPPSGFGTSTSLFGAPAAQKPFGSTGTTGSIFGGATATNQPQTGGLFNTATTNTGFGSSFGVPQPQTQQFPQQQSIFAQPSIMIGSADSSEAAIRQAIIESQLDMYPYGDSQLLRSVSLKSDEGAAKEAVKQEMEKIRNSENYFALKLGKQDGLKETNQNAAKRYQSVLSAGRPSVFNYKPLVQRNGFASSELNITADTSQTVEDQTASSINDSFKIPRSNLFVPSLSSLSKKSDNPKHLDLSIISNAAADKNRSARLSSTAQSEADSNTSLPSQATIDARPARNLNFDLTPSTQQAAINRSDEIRDESFIQNESVGDDLQNMTVVHGPVGIVCSKRDIYTEPPIEQLDQFVVDGKVVLNDGFTIGRLGYGRIYWEGPISFSDVDLGDLVRFQRKQVTVYPDETKKPPIGEGFNKKAVISLENIFPHKRDTKEEIRDPLSPEAQKFSQILERKCTQMDCDFLEYDAETGVWEFRVKHFSRYGFFEDDEDEESISTAQQPKRHKPDPRPLRTIQESVEEQEEQMSVDAALQEADKTHGRTLGFDETMHDAASFIDPKSLFVSNFDNGKFKRFGIAEDIVDFIEPNIVHSANQTDKNYPIRQPTRSMSKFELNHKIFLDDSFKSVLRLHGHPLSRRIGFGPSTNTYVTALADADVCSSQVLVNKIKLVPTIEAYLLNYLKSKKREADFDELLHKPVLCMKPPSDFLRMIDSYLFNNLRNEFSLDIINEKMERFCAAICQDLSDVRFDILQRNAFLDWLRSELSDDLERKIQTLRLTGKSSPYASIFYCLHYGFIERAAEVAAEHGLFHLSMFIGMYINGRVSTRLTQYSRKMFESMKQVNNADPFRRRVYAILSGLLKFSHSGTTVDFMQSTSNNIQAFAIQLTFFATRKSNLEASMTELMTRF